MGGYTNALGNYSTAMGYYTNASADYSTSMGYAIEVGGRYSFGIGLDTTSRNISQTNTMAIMGGKVGIWDLSPAVSLVVHDDTRVYSGS